MCSAFGGGGVRLLGAGESSVPGRHPPYRPGLLAGGSKGPESVTTSSGKQRAVAEEGEGERGGSGAGRGESARKKGKQGKEGSDCHTWML